MLQSNPSRNRILESSGGRQSWLSLVGTRSRESWHFRTPSTRFFRDLNDGEGTQATASFIPAVDVYEDEKKVVLKLEVPGIEEKDLDVSVEKNTLTVKGERKFEKEEKEENFHRIERRYGSFYRAFTLPTTVDTDSVAASYNAGVLKVELTKKPEAQPKQIKVNVGQPLAA